MNKTFIILGVMALLLVGSVSAISADYYSHPECGHCIKIKDFMISISNYFNIIWVDTSIPKSYPISGTPTIIIHASDGRQVALTGSYEIPKYLLCEMNEQSTKECMTTSYLNCTTNSYFIRN
jgi:hypothetical protein